MADRPKRNNEYWRQRLAKDGHARLLDRINAGEITVYGATQLAGYRPKGPRTSAAKLSHQWKRASADERKRFVTAHLKEVNRALREVADELKTMKEQIAREEAGK